MDYKDFQKGRNVATGGSPTQKWWTLPKDEMPSCIAGIIQYISEHQGSLESMRQIASRLYANSNVIGTNGVSYTKLAQMQQAVKDRISYNVVQSVVDTITAKIAKNKPKPMFLTIGGDYKLQRKAKKLDKFVSGIFYENEMYKLGPEIFRDAAIRAAGVVHVFVENGRIKYERVIDSEIYVDEIEAFYGEPRQLHRVKNVDRQVMADLFPEHKDKIFECTGAVTERIGNFATIGDLITVAESWHLPSGPDADDGMHVVSINGCVLLSETWDKPWFPFVFLKWSKRMYGFWGQSLVEQIANIQLEINKLLWVIQRSMHLAGSFKVLLENGSKIVKEHLNNDIGAIITYSGTPPQYITPPIVPPEIYQHLVTLKNSAYEQAGISQLSASSNKPQGLNSGKALREYNDIESERFSIIGQQYENLFLDLAKLTVAIAKEHFSSYKVKTPSKKFIESIDWKDCQLEDDEFSLQLFPISSLPSTPEGKLQTIQEYMQAGLVDPDQGRRLLDFPDLDAVTDLQDAVEDRIHRVMEKMLDDGEYTPPDPTFNLTLSRKLCLQYYNQASNQNVEESKLALLQTFISQLDALDQEMAQAQAPQGMPGQGGAPGAVPQAPATSDMLPNGPGPGQPPSA